MHVQILGCVVPPLPTRKFIFHELTNIMLKGFSQNGRICVFREILILLQDLAKSLHTMLI